METRLKHIAFKFDEENRELLIERDGVYLAIPRRNLYSLRSFIARIYNKGFYRRKK